MGSAEACNRHWQARYDHLKERYNTLESEHNVFRTKVAEHLAKCKVAFSEQKAENAKLAQEVQKLTEVRDELQAKMAREVQKLAARNAELGKQLAAAEARRKAKLLAMCPWRRDLA